MNKNHLLALVFAIIIILAAVGCSANVAAQTNPVTIEIPPVSQKPVIVESVQPASPPIRDEFSVASIAASSIKKSTPAPVKAEIIGSGNTHIKQVALTFDDGPDGRFTIQILNILKKYNVKATFFVVGRNAQKYPAVLKRIASDGHVIANHSWDHKDFTKLNKSQIRNEISKTQLLINKQVGNSVPIVRMPYGAFNKNVLKTIADMGYQNIYWSVDAKDWSGISTAAIQRNIKKDLKPGAIILMHCSGKPSSISNTVKALPQIIEMLKKNGYKMVTVPAILK